MKASELRIGNIIYHDNCGKIEIITVEAIELGRASNGFEGHFVRYKGGSVTLQGFENDTEFYALPIPLTEEWLIKFGWGKSDEHELCDNSNQEFNLMYDTHFNKLFIETDSDTINFPHIEYVHQLQNLYFTLTGEELTLND